MGVAVTALAVATMAVDHLVGTDRGEGDEGAVDPGAFLVTAGLSLVVAFVVFGRVVPRAREDPVRADRRALVCSLLAVATLPLAFLGFPVVLGGGAVALGLIARRGVHRRVGAIAVALGSSVLLLGSLVYTVAALAD
jgi:uncharacterized membrane protein YozB (DUF420 family)